MEIKQISSILQIAQEGSISKAAEKLYISQSTLNHQLIQLERELGVSLFTRNARGVTPTYAGRIYLDNAQKMLDLRNNTYRELQDIADVKKGEISIALSRERGSRILGEVYPLFHKQYPLITLKLQEVRAKRILKMLDSQTVNIAITVHFEQLPEFTYWDLSSEILVLAVPRSHPAAATVNDRSWESLPHADLSEFRDDAFILASNESIVKEKTSKVFDFAGFSPNILFEASDVNTVVELVRKQVACGLFMSGSILPCKEIAYFSITPEIRWINSVVTSKSRYLNAAEKAFINMCIHLQKPMEQPAFTSS